MLALLIASAFAASHAQILGDQLGSHDLGSMRAPVSGGLSNSCLYCHAPHGAGIAPTPMWNQQLSTQVYSMYESSTYHQQGLQPGINSPSKECLSCHDGTVAPGQTVAYGIFQMRGEMKKSSKFGNDLKSSHPFSLKTPFTDAPEINALLFGNPPKTADPEQKVKLINGNIECTSCHDPHFQGIDNQVPMFLVRDSSHSQMCLACHDPDRVVSNYVNYLAGWEAGIHSTAANSTANKPYVGGYPTVRNNGCNSCHMPHNAAGPVRLLRGPDEQDCISCHNGTNLDPAIPSIFAEYGKATGHPFPSLPNNTHDRAEPVLLNNNRHATCADCHNPHAAQQVTAFGAPPGVRGSQAGLAGIKASDGTTVINPSVNQYENCLRCHGTSIGKVSDPIKYGYLQLWAVSASDPLNVIPQFDSTATSSHPVTHDRSSPYAQPSLRIAMMQLDGSTPGRAMGTRIFCTDCHNADDNREFGGQGPNGPHGSKWTHIFERRYEFSQAPGPGQPITNLFPKPDLTVTGPYALCAKCHDLSNVVSDASWNQHSRHINDGFSCSVCHTGHGMGAKNPNISGERLVNFDVNVVAANGSSPISYNRAMNSCTLTCHGHPHASSMGQMKPAGH